MSANSIIANCKYQLYRLRSVPLFYLIWVIGSMLISATIRSVAEKVPFSLRETGQNGFDALIGLFVFGYMCANITDFFNTAAANGTSRTTACVSAYISSVILSVVSALEVSVIFPIMSLITGEDEMWGASLYGVKSILYDAGWSNFAIRVRYFGIAVFSYIALCAAVIFIAALMYKLPGWASLITILLLIFIPTGGIYFALGEDALASFWCSVMKLVGLSYLDDSSLDASFIGNASQGAAVFIGASLILLLISCLITRRSSVKPLAIKGS